MQMRPEIVTKVRKCLELLFIFGVFTFLFHFIWEVLQSPFFLRMANIPHWEGALICLRATGGDVIIALIAYGAGAWWSKSYDWLLNPPWQAITTYMAVGVLITIGFEWYAVHWANRWAYSDLMPIVWPLKVGLTPILQWVILPPIVLYFARQHLQLPLRMNDAR